MSARLPYGGAEIAALRATGKRPADMVMLSLIGPLPGETNPVVIAKPGNEYDLRFLVGLDVLVVTRSSIDGRAVGRITSALMDLPARYVGVWMADKGQGSNLRIDGWRPKTPAVRRMGLFERREFAGIGVQP